MCAQHIQKMSHRSTYRIKGRDATLDAQVKEKVANIMNVPNDNQWELDDVKGDLYVFNYLKTSDMKKYGNIHGIVYDNAHNCIVSTSYPYSPVVYLSQPKIQGETFIDEFKNSHNLSTTSSIQLGVEGTQIRAFYHDGKFYVSTHRNLDPHKARWGNSPTFASLYENLGGLKVDQLFDTTKKYGLYTYHFIIVHPDLTYASKIPVGDGYLVYNGFSLNDMSGMAASEVDTVIREPETIQIPKTNFVPEKKMYKAPEMTVDEMNQFLQYGFHAPTQYDKIDGLNYRYYPGEFVIVQTESGVVKIQSPSYTWRVNMRGSDPNLKHRVYCLIDDTFGRVYKSTSLNEYVKKYPILTPHTVQELRDRTKTMPMIYYHQNRSDNKHFNLITTNEGRLHNTMLNMWIAAPVHQQQFVLNYYLDYLREKQEVIDWLKTIVKTGLPEGLYERTNLIIQLARTQAQVSMNKGEINQSSLVDYVDYNIQNSIMRENGSSFYKIAKNMYSIIEQK